MVDQNSEVRKILNATTMARKGTLRKNVGVIRREEGKEPEVSNAQGCVASTSDDGEILCSEATAVSKGKKWLSDIWLIDSGAT